MYTNLKKTILQPLSSVFYSPIIEHQEKLHLLNLSAYKSQPKNGVSFLRDFPSYPISSINYFLIWKKIGRALKSSTVFSIANLASKRKRETPPPFLYYSALKRSHAVMHNTRLWNIYTPYVDKGELTFLKLQSYKPFHLWTKLSKPSSQLPPELPPGHKNHIHVKVVQSTQTTEPNRVLGLSHQGFPRKTWFIVETGYHLNTCILNILCIWHILNDSLEMLCVYIHRA